MREFRAACRDFGETPALVGVAGWNETALLAEAGIPSVLFGPGGPGARSDEEWVDLQQVGTCAENIRRIPHRFRG